MDLVSSFKEDTPISISCAIGVILSGRGEIAAMISLEILQWLPTP